MISTKISWNAETKLWKTSTGEKAYSSPENDLDQNLKVILQQFGIGLDCPRVGGRESLEDGNIQSIECFIKDLRYCILSDPFEIFNASNAFCEAKYKSWVSETMKIKS